jgi:hypothetical protein
MLDVQGIASAKPGTWAETVSHFLKEGERGLVTQRTCLEALALERLVLKLSVFSVRRSLNWRLTTQLH